MALFDRVVLLEAVRKQVFAALASEHASLPVEGSQTVVCLMLLHCLLRLYFQLALAQKQPARLTTIENFVSGAPLTLPRRTSDHLNATSCNTAWMAARPATSISSLQATWHGSIRSTKDRSPCPFLTRKLDRSCSLTFSRFARVC
jgi:hypothetical protein